MKKPKKGKDGKVHLAVGGRLTSQFVSSTTETRPLEAGYTGLEPNNSSTVPNDPSQAITRAKDANKKIAPSVSTSAPQAPGTGKVQTITDGSTKVKSTLGAPGKYEPNDVSAGARQAFFNQHGSYPPCLNPDCKSHGIPHPNCLCYGPTSQAGTEYGLAHGGQVEDFCERQRMHAKGCEYYKEGGEVGVAPVPQFQDDAETTLDHSGVDQGLIGLLKHTGQAPRGFDSDKHKKVIDDAKSQHLLRQNPMPGMEDMPQTPGNKLGNMMADGDYEKAANTFSGHPLTGTISPNKLKPILERMAGPLLTQESNPEALRCSVDYLGSSMRGQNKFNDHMNRFFEGDYDDEANDDDRDALKEHLKDIQDNPGKALDAGGHLGHYLPDHGAALGAKAAIAMNYLNSLKPSQSQNSPLDDPTPIDIASENKYNRQLDLANNPMLILKHAKEGTLQPQDLATVHTLYPKLAASIKAKIGEKLIDHKSKKKDIPYPLRQSMSMLLGQPMDSTMTPQFMQSIIQSAGAQQQAQQGGKNPKATGIQLKQMNMVTDMFKTRLQSMQSSSKS